MQGRKHISGWFIILFLTCSFIVSATTVWHIRKNTPLADSHSLLSGKWASLYEDNYNENLASFEVSKNIWGILNYALFREGRDGVLVSDTGWLFTSEEFQGGTHDEKNFQENVSYIQSVRDVLAKHDVNLLVVPVPAKARVYEDLLAPYNYPSYKEEIYGRFMTALARESITVADTLAVMRKYRRLPQKNHSDLYLKTDTHWSPQGAKMTAALAAWHIQNQAPDLIGEDRKYHTQAEAEDTFSGDLARYIPVGMFKPYAAQFQEDITLYETTARGADENTDLSGALFGNDVPSIALVGTSYSANEKWNFDGFLKEYLQADVLNAADEGLGPFETMDKYLQDKAFIETPPRLIVWEIPERYLTFEYNLKSVPDAGVKA